MNNHHFDNPDLILSHGHSNNGVSSWQSPSNIALIKYWGKSTGQIPKNPSISMTLSEAHTYTTVKYQPRGSQDEWIKFTFEGAEAPSFAARIEKFLGSLSSIFPFLKELSLAISSENSFPHSSGIASSASSMSALALCLCDIERALFGTLSDDSAFLAKASFISRLGSGSACRSVYPHLALWGKYGPLDESSDYYAVPWQGQEVFNSFHDDVVIVSGEKKSVSSSAGHALMDTNPFAATRYQQAQDNMTSILECMQTGDLMRWGEIVEDEAMTLHALMMCSHPSYILMKPGTLICIDRIRAFRQETGLPLFFTLDAGPNVHILYPDSIADKAQDFIKSEIMPLAENGRIIPDQVGIGAKQMV